MNRFFLYSSVAALSILGVRSSKADVATDYWRNPGFVTLNVGQGTYLVPGVAPLRETDIPSAQLAGYREGPAVVQTPDDVTRQTVPGDVQFSVGNGRIMLPAFQQ